jgi:hypothetical protein
MVIHRFFGQLREEKYSLGAQIRQATINCLVIEIFIVILTGAIIAFVSISFRDIQESPVVLRNIIVIAVFAALSCFLCVRSFRMVSQKRRLRVEFFIWCNERMTFLENEYQLVKSKLPFGKELKHIDWDNLSERLDACEWSLDTMRAFADVVMNLQNDPQYQIPDDDSLHTKYFGSWRK